MTHIKRTAPSRSHGPPWERINRGAPAPLQYLFFPVFFMFLLLLPLPTHAQDISYERQSQGIPEDHLPDDPYLRIHPDPLARQLLKSLESLQNQISHDRALDDPNRLLRLAIAFEELSRYLLARERLAYHEDMALCIERGEPSCNESILPDFSQSDACVNQAQILYEDVMVHFTEYPAAFEARSRASELRMEMGEEPIPEDTGATEI